MRASKPHFLTVRPRFALVAPLAALLGLCGCASWMVADADREVGAALRDYQARVLGDRESWVKLPRDEPQPQTAPASDANADGDPQSDEGVTGPLPDDDPAATEFDLAGSIRQAISGSREFQTQRESLYRSGLSLTLARYNFGPILNSTINWVWNYNEGAPKTQQLTIPAGVRQILPLGGEISGAFSADAARVEGGEPASDRDYRWNTDYQVNLQQPLLRGAGYEYSHEALTQSQRNLVYAVRSFELFRQDFAILVANRYFQLVSQRKRLGNDEQNYKDAVYDRKKAEALRSLDRNKPDDVFQARRREIDAETALVGSRANFKLALDDFKILLGLPTDMLIRVKDAEPPFELVRVETESAVQVALANRLDLQTQRDQLDDVKRGVRFAKQDLLPQFDLTGSYGIASRGGLTDDATANRRSGSFGATLDLPIDRVPERNAYRAALLDQAQATRNLQQSEDEIERDIRNAIRELKQFEKQIELQKEQVQDQNRAVAVMGIRVNAGEAQQRELSDARQSLNNAQNALIELTARHFIAKLTLRRNLGILFIDENGMWLP